MAKMSDTTEKEVPVVWNPGSINTSEAGVHTATGKVEGYGESVIITVIVEAIEVKIESIVQPNDITVQVGEKVELPVTVTANMSDGTTKKVPVNWEPNIIDTSTAGTRTTVGTVEGYNGSVTLTVIVVAVEVGDAQISLYKDSTSSNNKVNFDNITGFYLKNKETGKIYSDGKIPSQIIRKNQFEMKDIPEGKYTIHAVLPDGMVIKEIQLGEAYKETIYDAETNPVVIDGDKNSYVKMVIKAEHTIKEIKPLEALTVPVDITLDEFKEALPKQTSIVDSSDKEHQVDLKWDIRPSNFEGWKKPGEIKLWSEFFTLPLSVSNTDPTTRLEVTLNVKFAEATIESIEPLKTVTVQVGDEVILPATVTANLSDGTTKEVAVSWEPSVIDTSKAGSITTVGTVEGYNGSVTLTVVVEAIETGAANISLFKDSTSSSNKVNFENITNFYLKNKETGKIYSDGTIPSQSVRKNQFEMKDIPKGKYTLHFDTPSRVSIEKILIGDSSKETVYDAETNPYVIVKDKTNYVKLVMKSDVTLQKIKPLEDLTVPTDITMNDFISRLPKKTIIVDSLGNEHQVDLKWDIRPSNFESYKKNGGTTLWSEFFTLPLSVSNTVPATRLEVMLKVKFAEATIESIDPIETVTVKVGEKVILPATVTANISDGTTKEVPVSWEPSMIDTSKAGTITAVGTVEGYNGSVILTVVVEVSVDPMSINSKSITNLDFSTKAATHAKLESKPVTVGDFTGNRKEFTININGDRIPVYIDWRLSTDFPIGMSMGSVVDSHIQQYYVDKGGATALMNRPIYASGTTDTFQISTFQPGSASSFTLEGPDWSYFFDQSTVLGTDVDTSKNRTFTVSDGTNIATIQLTSNFGTIDALVNFINSRLTNADVGVKAEKLSTTQFKITLTDTGILIIDGVNKFDFFE